MSRRVCFIDTSVLVVILDVPHMNDGRPEVLVEFDERRANQLFVLPITTVIETGNHIAQVASGHHRREAADRFAKLLRATVEARAPWVLHEAGWGASFLATLLDGTSTVPGLVDAATQKIGTGDLAILAETDAYRARTSGVDVTVWTHDTGLGAHST